MYRDLVQETINLNKLNKQYKKLENQLKTKRTTYSTHKILISDLKYKLIFMSQYSKDKTIISSLLKEKDKEIKILR